ATTVHGGLEHDVVGDEVALIHLGIRLDERLCVSDARNLDQPGQRLDGLALAEVVAEGDTETGHFMVFLEPVLEESPRDLGRSFVTALSPDIHRGSDLRHEQQGARTPAGLLLSPACRQGVVLDKVGSRSFPRTAPWDFREVLVVGNDSPRHLYFTST